MFFLKDQPKSPSPQNGVRTLPQYHPWNALKSHDDILNALEADIICFQEMKSARPALPKTVAVPPSYDSFFSFPLRKSGYSGVAVYTRTSSVIPIKAEEGLTGFLQPKPPLTSDERISPITSYPPDIDTPEGDAVDLKELDAEGRALVLDFGLFVLINVYCPNDGTGTEERDLYKMGFHRLLSARVRQLVEEGREVVVVGDINACAAILDHCEGPIMMRRAASEGKSTDEVFYERECRLWLKDWLIEEGREGGQVVDVVRRSWPDRKGMYTCWNTKISARDSNYGTRIDYILLTPGLLPWIKAADIQPHIKGSDHCPVYVDFYDQIVDGQGKTVKLAGVLGAKRDAGGKANPPRLAAKFWDEHSGKQKLLGQFFVKKDVAPSLASPLSVLEPSPERSHSLTPTPASAPAPPSPATLVPNQDPLSIPPDPLGPIASSEPPSSSPSTTSQLPTSMLNIAKSSITSTSISKSSGGSTITKSASSPPAPPTATKRKMTVDSGSRKKQKPGLKPKQEEKKAEQTKLASYFRKSAPANSNAAPSPSTSKSKSKSRECRAAPTSSSPSREESDPEPMEVDEDADYRLALMLSQESTSSSSRSSIKNGNGSKQAWSSLLAPIQAPKCTVHNEPAKEFTVNKQGPNRGKRFFICSRPVGPGYDKGRAERLREDVDPQWRCDFFKWSSDVKKDMMKGKKVG